MLDLLNRHLMHPLMAWREGKKHLQYLRTLRQTQFDPAENQRVWNPLPIEMCSADAVANPANWRCANSTGNPGETPAYNCIDFFGNHDVPSRCQCKSTPPSSAEPRAAP